MAWYRSTGFWCLAVAALHVATTSVFYGDSLGWLLDGPLVGALDAEPDRPSDRGAAFWYVLSGVLLAVLGVVAWQAERAEGVAVAGFGIVLTLVGAAGAVLSPLSGFWLLLLIGLVALRRRRSTGHHRHQGPPA